MTAEWRPVVGWEGRYEVSSLGAIRRASDKHVISQSVGCKRTGHLKSRLGPKKQWVHIVVAEAFIGPRTPGIEVRHMNGVSSDNRAENLRYGTRSQQRLDDVRNGVHPMAKKTHCKRDHPLSGANLRIEKGRSGPVRRCLTCKKERRS
ncbi:HNH endonuclease [Rhodococcus phage Finch]|uniref:HNH endonuclease n=1 Tax=Rhodococcus phage Finch TaxID=2094144 RepID=A0A2P1JXX3_9CAUD|nr:HNH endonuclease [Rhodococcus phage Finch]AVO25175.1 HNH endonuclease [Rhodococcus phage Finch]